jgi:hypothetical protein
MGHLESLKIPIFICFRHLNLFLNGKEDMEQRERLKISFVLEA